MPMLGEGRANGGCSLLHAAGLGYGVSLGLDLPVLVRLYDRPLKKEPEDPHGLLTAVLEAWSEASHPRPAEAHWSVRSSIPPGQGLKSSAAVAVAALRALSEGMDVHLNDEDIVELAGRAQLKSGTSMTGAYDDAWAAAAAGWKLVDAGAEDAAHRVVLEGPGPVPEDWTVLIITGEARLQHPHTDLFRAQAPLFQQALNAVQEGQLFVALTMNGRAMVGVTDDAEGRRLANDAFVNGARAAGLTGSGPAIVVVVPSAAEALVRRLEAWYAARASNRTVLKTTFVQAHHSGEGNG